MPQGCWAMGCRHAGSRAVRCRPCGLCRDVACCWCSTPSGLPVAVCLGLLLLCRKVLAWSHHVGPGLGRYAPRRLLPAAPWKYFGLEKLPYRRFSLRGMVAQISKSFPCRGGGRPSDLTEGGRLVGRFPLSAPEAPNGRLGRVQRITLSPQKPVRIRTGIRSPKL
jgi:hypothetical protein